MDRKNGKSCGTGSQGQYACDKAAVDAIVKKAKEDLSARKNNNDFEKYKAEKIRHADSLLAANPSDTARNLIDGAKKQLEALTYDPAKTPEQNQAGMDAVISKLEEDLKAAAQVNPGKITSEEAEAKILAMTGDKDLPFSVFSDLELKQKSTGKQSIAVTWKDVPGATSYTVFGSRCGQKFRKLAEVKNNQYTHKKLQKGKYYKYIVVVNGGGNALSTSKTAFVATGGGRAGNVTRISTPKKTLKVRKGRAAKIRISVKKSGSVKNYRKTLFESTDTKVAKVNKKGKVKAVGKGKCYVYCYAQNGTYAKVKVMVK